MHQARRLVLLLLGILLLTGCSVSRFIPEGDYLLDKVSIRSDSAGIRTGSLEGYIRQQPNSRWFNVLKVPMLPYLLSGRDSTRRFNRFMHRIGENPVLYDSTLAIKTQSNIQSAVRNMGYLNATVDRVERVRGDKMQLTYQIHPQQRYSVRSIEREIEDEGLQSRLEQTSQQSLLREGMPLDMNVLDQERSRIHSQLSQDGYYRFSKDFIRYEADTTVGGHQADLLMRIIPFYSTTKPGTSSHRQYRFGHVNLLDNVSLDDVMEGRPVLHRYEDYRVLSIGRPTLRPAVFTSAIAFREGDLYDEQKVENTYARVSRFGAIRSTQVRLIPAPEDSLRLDAYISFTPNKPNSCNVEVEGTNSAGDLGAALSLSYQNRNIFRGSETFHAKVRGAFEAIKGLEGYADQNYIEYSAEVGLTFPDFKFPFLPRDFRKEALATSEVSFLFDSQDRPEFHRRVLTGAWRYRWSRYNRRLQHRIDLLDLNYVFMPWISDTFREKYLEDPESRNAILRYNYENLFIMKWGYTFTYNSRPFTGANSNYGTDAYSIRVAVETAGNLLDGCSTACGGKVNEDGQYTLFNIAYAQYAKVDFDFSKSIRFTDRHSMAMHFGLGVAYPYGNSTILPYEKRYFSGGANSVRGWSVRELGPGTFRGSDGRIDFINQTGDVKLDMNVEYRTHLFWKFDGAAFVDAGNIWTLREYEEQPGGQFHFDSFWRQIAVAYGIGLRLNFDYFILRLDAGMKAIHPSYTDAQRRYPIVHPNMKRDLSIHFAVGLPF